MWVSFWKGWLCSMKKILLVVLCVVLAVSAAACGGNAEPEDAKAPEKTAESMREEFFEAFYQMLGETENSEEIKGRVKKYETQEMNQNSDDEREYSFTCDTGFKTPQESIVAIWTNEDGEAKAMACASSGNEGRPIFEAMVKTFVPDMEAEALKDELFDFAYVNESDSTVQIGDATITKAFNNGGNVVTTGGISAVYSVCKTADLEDEDFKDYFDEHRNALEIAVLF